MIPAILAGMAEAGPALEGIGNAAWISSMILPLIAKLRGEGNKLMPEINKRVADVPGGMGPPNLTDIQNQMVGVLKDRAPNAVSGAAKVGGWLKKLKDLKMGPMGIGGMMALAAMIGGMARGDDNEQQQMPPDIMAQLAGGRSAGGGQMRDPDQMQNTELRNMMLMMKLQQMAKAQIQPDESSMSSSPFGM